jgi:glycosyltransferase involved in cell wall biosynthesis
LSKPLKLSVVIPSFYPAFVYGGWVYSSINTCKELAKLGVECYVSTTNDNADKPFKHNHSKFIKLFDNIFVKYYRQNIRERLSINMFWGLWKDIRQSNVVHVQGIFSASTPIALFVSSLFSKRVVLSPHGCLGEWCMADGNAKLKKPFLKYLVKPYLKKVIWHATSLQEKNEILALFPKANITIIPNGIYAEEFSQPNYLSKQAFIEKFTGLKNCNHQVIVSMARLHKKKGFDILIEAFARSTKKYPNTLLIIAGEDFGEKKNLLDLVNKHQLEQKVFFIGHIDGQDRVDFFAHADLFALSSHNENFGLVYAEAMAAGTPILASTFTPWQEVENYGIGKWVANEVEHTSKALNDLLASDLKTMGEKSKQFITEHYTWQKIGYQFKELFEEIAMK